MDDESRPNTPLIISPSSIYCTLCFVRLVSRKLEKRDSSLESLVYGGLPMNRLNLRVVTIVLKHFLVNFQRPPPTCKWTDHKIP